MSQIDMLDEFLPKLIENEFIDSENLLYDDKERYKRFMTFIDYVNSPFFEKYFTKHKCMFHTELFHFIYKNNPLTYKCMVGQGTAHILYYNSDTFSKDNAYNFDTNEEPKLYTMVSEIEKDLVETNHINEDFTFVIKINKDKAANMCALKGKEYTADVIKRKIDLIQFHEWI